LALLLVAGCSDGAAGPAQPASIRTNQIVFLSARVAPAQLFVINDDGSGVRQLTRSGYDRGDPDVSPDGAKIAFTMWAPDVSCLPTYPTCGHEIYVMDAAGSNERRLTINMEQDGHPAWSPDGSRIAFAGARSGSANIYVMNADGTGQRQVTALSNWNYQPAWSPDGSRIAFARAFSGADGVYIVNADGTGSVTRLSPSFGEWPAWSPNGSRVAYSDIGIVVIDVDGTGAVHLTDGSFDWMPTWSSDGTRIAFARGYDEVYVVNADGSGLVNLTNHEFQDYDPAWGRAR
jgi:TolB protein